MRAQSILLIAFIASIVIGFTDAAEKKKITVKTEQVELAAECETILNQTAVLIKAAMLVDSKSWPSTIEELNKHCELGNAVYKNIKQYGKCLSGLSRQAVNIFLRGLKKFMQNICLSNKRKQETIDIMKCTSNETVAGWSKCLHVANQKLDYTASNASDPAILGNICCAYSGLLECVAVNTPTIPNCLKSGSQDAATFLGSSINLIVRDLTELLCGNYATKEDCDKHNAGRLEALKYIADGKHQVNGAFLLSPLVKATKQLGDIHADDI